MTYNPTFKTDSIYRYLLYVIMYNHCLSISCNDCSMYFKHTNHAFKHCCLKEDDWITILNGVGILKDTEKPIIDILRLTDDYDDLCSNDECRECKFRMFDFNRDEYVCAPFSTIREVTRKVINYRGY